MESYEERRFRKRQFGEKKTPFSKFELNKNRKDSDDEICDPEEDDCVPIRNFTL
jgi:hypothetical protein